jgi:hypothetical protein
MNNNSKTPSFFSINPHHNQQPASPRSLSFEHQSKIVADYFSANIAARAPIDTLGLQEKLGVTDDDEFKQLLVRTQLTHADANELDVYSREIKLVQ